MAAGPMPPTPLTDLCLRFVRSRPRTLFRATLTTPAEALALLTAATDEDLRALGRCFPRAAGLPLRRLQRALELPEAPVTAVIRRLEALPPDLAPDPFTTPEGVDWAVERFRTLFRRR